MAAGAEAEVRAAEARRRRPRARRSASRSCWRGDVEALKKRSRNYARRQLTWMRKMARAGGDRRHASATPREAAERVATCAPRKRRDANGEGAGVASQEARHRRCVALALAAPTALRGAPGLLRHRAERPPPGPVGSVPPPDGSDRPGPPLRRADAAVRPRPPRRPHALLQVGQVRHAAPGGRDDESVPARPGLRIRRDRFNVPHIFGRTAPTSSSARAGSRPRTGACSSSRRAHARVGRAGRARAERLRPRHVAAQFVPGAQTEAELAKQTQVLESQGREGPAGDARHRRVRGRHQRLLPLARATPPSRGRATTCSPSNALIGAVVRQGRRRRGAQRPSCSTSSRQASARARASRSGDDLRKRAGPRGRRCRSTGRFPYVTDRRGAPRQRDRRRRLVQAPTAARAARAARRAAGQQRAAGRPQALRQRAAVRGRGPAGRLLLPAVPDGARPPRRRDRGARRHLRAVPGLRAARPRRGLRLDATSSGADNIDQYLEELCDGSATKYAVQGPCRDMERFDAGHARRGRPKARRSPVVFSTHGARAGERLRDRARQAVRGHAQALELRARRR